MCLRTSGAEAEVTCTSPSELWFRRIPHKTQQLVAAKVLQHLVIPSSDMRSPTETSPDSFLDRSTINPEVCPHKCMYSVCYLDTDEGDDSGGHLMSTEKPDLRELRQLPQSDATPDILHIAAARAMGGFTVVAVIQL